MRKCACSCRFLKPGSNLPAVQDAPFSKDPYFYIYNGTCMLEERNVLIAAFEKPKDWPRTAHRHHRPARDVLPQWYP